MQTITLRVADETAARLDALVKATARPKSYYLRTLIEDNLAELEYIHGLDVIAEKCRKGECEEELISYNQMLNEYGFTRDELLAEGAKEFESAV